MSEAQAYFTTWENGKRGIRVTQVGAMGFDAQGNSVFQHFSCDFYGFEEFDGNIPSIFFVVAFTNALREKAVDSLRKFPQPVPIAKAEETDLLPMFNPPPPLRVQITPTPKEPKLILPKTLKPHNGNKGFLDDMRKADRKRSKPK